MAGRLIEIFDDKTEPGAGRESDPVLVQILAESRGQELWPRFATIQGEQDELIRADDKIPAHPGRGGYREDRRRLHRLASFYARVPIGV